MRFGGPGFAPALLPHRGATPDAARAERLGSLTPAAGAKAAEITLGVRTYRANLLDAPLTERRLRRPARVCPDI